MNNKLKELKEYRKMLYIIDMVNGFTKEGALHDPRILNAVPEQLNLLEKFKSEKEGISFIKDSHEKGCVEFKTFPEHCVKGTSEAELISELKPYENMSHIYLKNSTSAMFAKGMINDLKNMQNLKEVVGCGCLTDVCVPNFLIPLKNFFNEINKDVAVFLVKNATETYNSPTHDRDYYTKIACDLMAQSGVIIVDNLEELEEKEKQYGLYRKEGR